MAGLIGVAIVDDHPATASGLAALLAREPDLHVLGTAGFLAEAIELLERQMPDVALVDIQLGGQPAGFEILRRCARPGGPAVILFSSYDYPGFHARAIELGARGYLAKTAPLAEIVAAIRRVAASGTAFSAAAIDDARQAPRPPSERELQVIRLLAAGYSNDEIGARLGLTEKSVESHLRRLFGRYGVATRTELALLAVRQGWIEPGK
ncbi:MAG: response regulator [Candidatus Limnocylindrales bacterium]